MPTLIFERTRHTADHPDGGRLADLCDDDFRAGIPLACRHANCGICRVRVAEGAELCDAPGEDERALLQGRFHDPPDVRLACQLTVLPGPGTVRLRVLL
jgi:ferredoxin